MKRRTLLAAAATGAAGFAGCLATGNGNDGGGNESDGGNATSDGASDGGGGETDDGGNEETDDGGGGESDDGGGDTGGDDGIPTVENAEIETTAQGCGSTDAGDATAERGDGTVTIDGTVGASDPCHEAVLRGTEIHNRQLVVTVGVEATGNGACQQCLGAIDYTATVSVENVGGLHGATAEHVDGDEHATNWDEPGESTP